MKPSSELDSKMNSNHYKYPARPVGKRIYQTVRQC